MKKLKLWYKNISIYDKQELILVFLSLLIFTSLVTLDVLGFFNGGYFNPLDCLVFLLFSICFFLTFIDPIENKRFEVKLKDMYYEAEKKVVGYFDRKDSNILEIVPKNTAEISNIVSYFSKKEKIIESYWVELNELNNTKVFYISVLCKEETDRCVYPETFKNFCYLLHNFNFKSDI